MRVDLRLRRRVTAISAVLALGFVFIGCNRSLEATSAKHIERGKKLLQKKDTARAILEFRNATRATPRNAEAFYQLGAASVMAGDLNAGVASLRKALELNPKHPEAQLQLARLMIGTNSPDTIEDGRRRLEELVKENPDNFNALHALGLAEWKLGQRETAVKDLERAAAVAPKEILLAATLAQAKLQQNDPRAAEEILKRATENDPGSVDAVLVLGRLYWLQKRVGEAEQQYRKAVTMDPKHGRALLNLAMLQYELGRKQEAEQSFKRVSESPDQSLNSAYAQFLFQEGRRDEAVKEFERLARQDPTDRQARGRLVAVYQAVSRLTDAQNVLSEALKKNAKDLDALLQRSELFLRSGKYEEAGKDLNQVLRLRPDSAQVHYFMAKVHQARGAIPTQRQELNEALRFDPAFLGARIELAKSLLAEDSGRAALAVLDETPAPQKSLGPVIEQRNWALIAIGQLAEARKGVDQGLAASRTPDLLIQDALLKIRIENRHNEGRRSLHEALAIAPEDLRVLRVLVNSHIVEKHLPAALADVRAHANKYPRSAPIQYFWGNLLFETGDRMQAGQALAAAKAANPGYTPADLALARIDLTAANWKDGRQKLNSILARNDDTPLARQWLGMVEMSVGNVPAAIAHFRKVLESQPNNALVLNNLAYLLVEQGGGTDEPLKYAQRAKELDPNNPEVDDTLGWVLYRKALYDVAVPHLERAVAKQPTAVRRYHLAMAYYKAGQIDRGQTTYKLALRMDPNLPEANAAKQLFAAAAGRGLKPQ